MRLFLATLFLAAFVLVGCDQAAPSLAVGSDVPMANSGTCDVPTLNGAYNIYYAPAAGDHAVMDYVAAEDSTVGQVRYDSGSGWGQWFNLIHYGNGTTVYLLDDFAKVATTRFNIYDAQYRLRSVCGGTTSAWSSTLNEEVQPAY